MDAGQILLKHGLLSDSDLSRAVDARTNGARVDQLAVEMGLVGEADALRALGVETGVDFLDLEPLYDVSASSGEPYDFAYFNREIWLYPVPEQVYTIRVIGLYKVAGPATDGEADNPWMTEAYELIRYRAEAYLAANSLRNPELAGAKLQAEADALSSLRAETTKRASLGTIQGSGW